MFSLFFSEYLDHCVEALLHSPDKRIQKVLQALSMSEEGYEQTLRQLVYQFTIRHIEELTEPERIDDLLEEYIIHLGRFLEKTQYTYIIEVRLRGYEQELWRLLRVPANFMVADLCYMIFASMQLNEAKDFYLGYRHELYFGGDLERIEALTERSDDLFPAFLFPLAMLQLHKNSKMSLLYDLDESFIFELVVKDVIKTDAPDDQSPAHVIAGQGMGFLSLGRERLEALYEELGKMREDVWVDTGAAFFPDLLDLKELNTRLVFDMQNLRDLYEAPFADYLGISSDDEEEDEDELDIPWFC